MNDPAAEVFRKRILERIRRLSEATADKGLDESDLDDLVRDCADEQASDANNGGLAAQLHFLLTAGWSPSDILGRLDIATEKKSEPTGGVMASVECPESEVPQLRSGIGAAGGHIIEEGIVDGIFKGKAWIPGGHATPSEATSTEPTG